jgi:N-acetylneuraminic acid mutarotase
MHTRRLATILALLGLLLGGPLARGPGVGAEAAPTGSWTPVASPLTGEGPLFPLLLLPLPANRFLLLSSTVREPEPRTRSQRYEPTTDRWSAPVPLAIPHRAAYAAAPLADGVLVVGGIDASGATFPRPTLADAERYDPATERWTPTAPLATPRTAHTATPLADGRVLVVGGESGGAVLATAEIYDPARDTWTPTAGMIAARSSHAATRLPDGRVLVTGGYSSPGGAARAPTATAEIYDPATDRWATAAPLGTPRGAHIATTLGNGQVLVTGPPLERYDPGADRWLPVAPPPASSGDPATRAGFSVTPLPGGQALVAGGTVREAVGCTGRFCRSITLPDTQRYDPATDQWRADAPLTAPRSGHQAAALPDGRVLVVGGGTPDLPPTAELYAPPVGSVACFAETGQCIQGRFLAHWQQHGGLAINGYPLTDERQERLEDGKTYTVQYFERVRLEYHPENPPPYDVLLGQFGRRAIWTVNLLDEAYVTRPHEPRSGATFFPETAHNVSPRFYEYWQANGGLAQFGYPLTEEIGAQLEEGKTYGVQYFERARFEYHPENAGTPYDVLLGQFGRAILAQNELLGVPGNTGEGILYITNEEVRHRLVPPAQPAIATPGTYQGFEHGAMIYRGDLRRIYVLCGDAARGTLLRARTFDPGDPFGNELGGASFPDTWTSQEPPGGGAGPRAGLYEPRSGFGKLWREDERVRACLGYAMTPGETASTIRLQPFRTSGLLSATTPAGRMIYAIRYTGWASPSSCGAFPDNCRPEYRGYPDPIP